MKIKNVVITGATGLLGNNTVREAISRGLNVKALVRNIEKAKQQFKDLPQVELIQFDMLKVDSLEYDFADIDAVIHTAAFFRDNYKGGKHWEELTKTNIEGTLKLLQKANIYGVKNFVHISSIATLAPLKSRPANEGDLRDENDADDYYKSKILSDKIVSDFGEMHPNMKIIFVIPGWMHGPGDMGPTSAGQLVEDFLKENLPAVPPGKFSIVDARDVAQIAFLALEKGDNGERFLAAGRMCAMNELVKMLEKISGIKATTFNAPIPLLYIIAFFAEIGARLFNQPALISFATLNLLRKERSIAGFDHTKTQQKLGYNFRPLEETLKDEIAWIKANRL